MLHLMESGDPGFFLARLGLWGGDSPFVSSKIKEDLTNGPLGKVQKLLDFIGLGVHSLGPVGDFLELCHKWIIY